MENFELGPNWDLVYMVFICPINNIRGTNCWGTDFISLV